MIMNDNGNGNGNGASAGVAVAVSVDWRSKGCINPVSSTSPGADHGVSQSDAAVDSVQCAVLNQFGKLAKYSVEQILDCAHPSGFPSMAMVYIRTNGLESEQNYPHASYPQPCKYDSGKVAVSVGAIRQGLKGNETDLERVVSTVSSVPAVIQVGSEFELYSGGVLTKCGNEGSIDVSVVGFTDEYWIIKNYWGSTWGENGYARLAKGVNNTCGISSYFLYPEKIFLNNTQTTH